MDYSEIVLKITPSIGKIFCIGADNKILGTGSGFIYRKKGMVITCDHVVEGSQSLVIKFSDSEEFYPTKVVLRDPEHDLAVLKIDDDKRNYLLSGEENQIKEGMPIVFAGYPLSLETLTTHQGILSAITKDAVGITTYLIDGTVNSGNSGCPLMNIKGEVIGVVNAKRRERNDLLEKVEKMTVGAVALHSIDIVEIYQALIKNVQLGIGYAVPVSYIPEHKEFKENKIERPSVNIKKIKNKK